ncbi:MAG: hypothetical protein ACUVV4_06860 [Candidatus Bathyarchaeia archaeon]
MQRTGKARYLVDANIFLELQLDQQKADVCETAADVESPRPVSMPDRLTLPLGG